jgi:hypothetical protein
MPIPAEDHLEVAHLDKLEQVVVLHSRVMPEQRKFSLIFLVCLHTTELHLNQFSVNGSMLTVSGEKSTKSMSKAADHGTLWLDHCQQCLTQWVDHLVWHQGLRTLSRCLIRQLIAVVEVAAADILVTHLMELTAVLIQKAKHLVTALVILLKLRSCFRSHKWLWPVDC